MKSQINVAVCLGLLLFFAFAIHELFAQESCTFQELKVCTQNMIFFQPYGLVKKPKPFLCDTILLGGGWIIIQRRVHQNTNFSRNWEDYKNGFGSPCTEDYWLGNEIVHQLTSQGQYELRIDMNFKEKYIFASYSSFKVDSETKKYKLTLGEFEGNVVNDFENHNNMMFSTPDRDNDKHSSGSCAQKYQAGWWYNYCHKVNLNGQFGNKKFGSGVIWDTLTTDYDSLSYVEMKIRKMNKELFAQESCKFQESKVCTQNMNSSENYVLVKKPKTFLCDAKLMGGGWIIIQRRVHQNIKFSRNWEAYKKGFGSPCTEDYWLGNERVHQLTSQGQYELRIDMKFKEEYIFASYSSFKVDSETKKYKLTLGEFKGDIENDFENHNNMMFSTPDRDNDKHPSGSCAQMYQAGWWYNYCHKVNLNGQFGNEEFGSGVIWGNLTTNYDSLSFVEMKIRKMN